MTELCPFCGASCSITNVRMSNHTFKPHCSNSQCLLSSLDASYWTEKDAAKAWNTRADKSPSPDAERLAKALRDCLNDIDGCEINMSNYGPDEVAAINNAYIQMYGAIENALADFEKGGS